MSKHRIGVVTSGAAAIALLAPSTPVYAGTSATAPDHDSAPDTAMSSTTSPIDGDELDFDDLDQGPAPEVGWFTDGAFHIGDQRWEFGTDPVSGFVDVADGFLASTNLHDINQRQLAHVGHDGYAEVVAEGTLSEPVAAHDGELVAWTEYETDESGAPTSSTVHVADNAGDVIASLDTVDALPVGFVNNHLVINERDEDGSTVLLFDYDHGVAQELTQYRKAWAVDDGHGKLLSVTGTDEGEAYSAVVNVAADGLPELWRSNDRRVESFAQGGAFAATVDLQTDGLGPNEVMINRADNGEALFGIEAELVQKFTWEPDGGSLVFDAWSQGQQALVRCVVADRSCELATEPAGAGEPGSEDPPYQLATD